MDNQQLQTIRMQTGQLQTRQLLTRCSHMQHSRHSVRSKPDRTQHFQALWANPYRINGLQRCLAIGHLLWMGAVRWIVVCCMGVSSLSVVAAPVVIEGVVPDQASKQALLNQLATLYPAQDIVDKIQVGAVTAPQGWHNSVAALMTPDLKQIRQGQLSVNGTAVQLRGKMTDPAQIQAMTALYQSLVQPPYRLNTQLSAHRAEQQLLDNTLKNRIVEFESGSAVLTATGSQILDEMVLALNKLQNKNIKIIGHTDNSGQAQKNIQLSQSRAEAVKNYLIAKGIAASRLSLAGMGANQPVADNSTAEGRKKNRRIEFEVL